MGAELRGQLKKLRTKTDGEKKYSNDMGLRKIFIFMCSTLENKTQKRHFPWQTSVHHEAKQTNLVGRIEANGVATILQ